MIYELHLDIFKVHLMAESQEEKDFLMDLYAHIANGGETKLVLVDFDKQGHDKTLEMGATTLI